MVDDFTFLASWRYIESVGDIVKMGGFFYDNINGRYASDMVALLLASSRVVSSLFCAAILTAIVWVTSRVLRIKSTAWLVVIAAALVFVPVGIFSQTIAWRAGFYVYVPPVLAVLLLWYLVERFKAKNSGRNLAYIIAVSFIGSLFVENITIGLGMGAAIYALVAIIGRYRDDIYTSVSVLVGVMVGLAVMFLSPSYAALPTDGEYRSLEATGSFTHSLFSNILAVIDKLLVDSWQLALLILVCIICLVLSRGLKVKAKYKASMLVLSVVTVALLAVFSKLITIGPDYTLTQKIVGAGVILLVCGMYIVFIGTMWSIKDIKMRGFAMVLVVLSLLILAPLARLTTSTISPRIFYPTYVLQVIACITVFLYTYREHKNLLSNDSIKVLKNATQGVVVVAFMLLMGIFGAISIRYIENNLSADRQVKEGASVVYLKKYPYDKILNQSYKRSDWPSMYYAKCKCQYRECGGCQELKIIYN